MCSITTITADDGLLPFSKVGDYPVPFIRFDARRG